MRLLIILVLCASLIGCQLPPRIYRFDVVQGNEIKEEQTKQLKAGLTKQQVQEIMGTPPVDVLFNSDRWDYYYSFKSGTSDEYKKQSLIIRFDENSLVKSFGK